MRKLKALLIGVTFGIIVTGLLIIMLPYRISTVLSNSMEPTLMTGEIVVVRMVREVTKGDIIAFFKVLNNDRQLLVKRVLGIGGDHIYCDGENLLVNEEIEGECKIPLDYVVPADCFFVMGDNRDHSYDSRYWEDPWVYKEEVVGKVIRKVSKWKEVS